MMHQTPFRQPWFPHVSNILGIFLFYKKQRRFMRSVWRGGCGHGFRAFAMANLRLRVYQFKAVGGRTSCGPDRLWLA
jgi:hypothetical protein